MTAAMRLLPIPLVLLASSAVAAPCEVAIARAPDEVRDAIETWVRAEPRCSTQLEIRVVPTQGGYYLFARDPAGHVRERIVPDAQSAGVLVASWVAEDVPGVEETVIEIVPPATITIDAGPLPAMVVDRVVAKAEPSPRTTRWLTLGGMVRMEGGGGGGFRAELDVVSRGNWSAGLSLGVAHGFSTNLLVGFQDSWMYGTLETIDWRGTATLARTSRRGSWELRLAGGLGVVKTKAFGYTGGDLGFTDSYYDGEGVAATAELSAQLSYRLGTGWAVGAGPLVTFYKQQLDGSLSDSQTSDTMPNTITRERPELSMFAGFRRAL